MQSAKVKIFDMNSQKTGLQVAAVIFAVFAIVHIVRLVKHISVAVGNFQVPLAVSWVALIVAGVLSIWMWRLSGR